MTQLQMYVRGESEEDYKKLKDFGLNMQVFFRKALKNKVKELGL